MKVLEVQHVVKKYGVAPNQVTALSDVSFTAESGEFIAIVGTSGSGKSTLLNLLGGLDVPTKGKIRIREHEIARLSRKEQTIFRRRNIGFVFQNYSLMPVLNVYDNVALPITFDKGSHIDHEYLKGLLKELGLWEKRTRYPNELSGGQQQRVAIARALANKPALLLADEPTGNLDSRTAVEVIGLLKASSQKYHQTVLMVTHNEALAQTCDRILRIEDGTLYQREAFSCEEGGEWR
ncbi:MAG: ABC transporter ATP-binding protein [Eubacteriales bacterium]|nr:ABC transporter ATP-binding protein [Eubacteriales bacterium]